MGPAFDPYHKWLGIPPEDQPPHHYRLLGIKEFEADPDVIQAAADQRMAHLRTYQTSRHADWSQRLLNDVAAAKICLLTPAKRAVYDEQRRATLRPQPLAAPELPFAIVVDESKPTISGPLRAKKRVSPGLILGGMTLIGAMVVAALAYQTMEVGKTTVLSKSPLEQRIDKAALDQERSSSVGRIKSKKPADGDGRDEVKKEKGEKTKVNKGAMADNGKTDDKSDVVVAPPSGPTSIPAPSTPVSNASQPKAATGPMTDHVEQAPLEPSPTLSEKPAADSEAAPQIPAKQKKVEKPKPQQVERAGEPSAEAQEEAMKLVRDRYKDELAKAKTAEDKQALAKLLLAQAEATTNRDANNFALLRLPRDSSVQAADTGAALAAIDAMSERFLIDALEMKAEAISVCAKKSRVPVQHVAVADRAERLADEAKAKGNVKLEKRLRELAKAERLATAPKPGKWLSLLPSPNELTGWEVANVRCMYLNRIIELRGGEMYYPIVVKDATIRAKVSRRDTTSIRLIVRNGDRGCYFVQLSSSSWSIIKATRNLRDASQGPAWKHRWDKEDTLSTLAVKRNITNLVFEMGLAAVGNTLTVFFNRQPILQARDAAFTEGMVGIAASDSNGVFVSDVEMLMPKGSFVADHRVMKP